jgi:hypothetical protein
MGKTNNDQSIHHFDIIFEKLNILKNESRIDDFINFELYTDVTETISHFNEYQESINSHNYSIVTKS